MIVYTKDNKNFEVHSMGSPVEWMNESVLEDFLFERMDMSRFDINRAFFWLSEVKRVSIRWNEISQKWRANRV